MSDQRTGPPPPGDEEEFRTIEAAVGQTARGRWFLAEYARRSRGADTDLVLAAIDRLEARLGSIEPALQTEPASRPEEPLPEPEPAQARQEIEAIKASLGAMASAITADAQEAAAIRHPATGTGTFAGLEGLTVAAGEIEAATSAVLDAAEHIQEIAWTLRERGADGAACDRLDQLASDIYAACAGGEVAAKRLRAFQHSLALIERHLAALGEALQITPAGPASSRQDEPVSGTDPNVAVATEDLDFVLMPEPGPEPGGPVQGGEAEATLSEAERRNRERLAILAEIDALGLHEKLKLFT